MIIARCVSPMASCRIVSALLGQSKTSTVAENWGTSVSEPSTSPARYSRETTSLSKGNTALGNAGAETRIRSRPSSVECQMAPTDRPKAANNPRTEAQRTLAPESHWQALASGHPSFAGHRCCSRGCVNMRARSQNIRATSKSQRQARSRSIRSWSGNPRPGPLCEPLLGPDFGTGIRSQNRDRKRAQKVFPA